MKKLSEHNAIEDKKQAALQKAMSNGASVGCDSCGTEMVFENPWVSIREGFFRTFKIVVCPNCGSQGKKYGE